MINLMNRKFKRTKLAIKKKNLTLNLQPVRNKKSCVVSLRSMYYFVPLRLLI